MCVCLLCNCLWARKCAQLGALCVCVCGLVFAYSVQRLNRWMRMLVGFAVRLCVGVFEGGPSSISQQISKPENPICLERQQAVHHLSWMDTISALSVTTTPPPFHPNASRTYTPYLSAAACMSGRTRPVVTETDRRYYHGGGCKGRRREE